MSAKLIDITGQTFGRLTAIKPIGQSNKREYLWECQCACGTLKIVKGTRLRSHVSKSCGCLASELTRARNLTNPSRLMHGYARKYQRTVEHRIWCDMRKRCRLPTASHYDRYGGRGIRVCERWLISFENFLHDMGSRPSSQHSLDRINVNGDYEPSNCRWATRSEQAKNKNPWRGELKRLRELVKQYEAVCGSLDTYHAS